MPMPEDSEMASGVQASGSGSSSDPPAPAAAAAADSRMPDAPARGHKRRSQGDDGDQSHKAWRVDVVDTSAGGMTYESLCETIKLEFPDLAAQWCEEFPELRAVPKELPEEATTDGVEADVAQDYPHLESGRPPCVQSWWQ